MVCPAVTLHRRRVRRVVAVADDDLVAAFGERELGDRRCGARRRAVDLDQAPGLIAILTVPVGGAASRAAERARLALARFALAASRARRSLAVSRGGVVAAVGGGSDLSGLPGDAAAVGRPVAAPCRGRAVGRRGSGGAVLGAAFAVAASFAATAALAPAQALSLQRCRPACAPCRSVPESARRRPSRLRRGGVALPGLRGACFDRGRRGGRLRRRPREHRPGRQAADDHGQGGAGGDADREHDAAALRAAGAEERLLAFRDRSGCRRAIGAARARRNAPSGNAARDPWPSPVRRSRRAPSAPKDRPCSRAAARGGAPRRGSAPATRRGTAWCR